MKRFFSLGLIATVLAAFTFTSCSKDDDDDASIVGKWQYTSMKIEGNGVTLSFEAEEGEIEIIEFKSDGTYVSTSEMGGDKEVVTGKYSTNGDVITVTDDKFKEEEKMKFSLSGNTLVFFEEGYYNVIEDTFYETQPEGEDYPHVKMSMIYSRK